MKIINKLIEFSGEFRNWIKTTIVCLSMAIGGFAFSAEPPPDDPVGRLGRASNFSYERHLEKSGGDTAATQQLREKARQISLAARAYVTDHFSENEIEDTYLFLRDNLDVNKDALLYFYWVGLCFEFGNPYASADFEALHYKYGSRFVTTVGDKKVLNTSMIELTRALLKPDEGFANGIVFWDELPGGKPTSSLRDQRASNLEIEADHVTPSTSLQTEATELFTQDYKGSMIASRAASPNLISKCVAYLTARTSRLWVRKRKRS